MTTLPVTPSPGTEYTVYFEEVGVLGELISRHLQDTTQCLVVTDHHVQEFYLDEICSSCHASGINTLEVIIPAGERSKSPEMLQRIYDEALEWGIDRQTAVIALGGGVVGDLAGYAAATLLRGLPLIHVPTSLVAQVDSSIGGKTGINHTLGKNLIGSFYQPEFVLSDIDLMSTLPDREWHCGLAELLKHALIGSSAHFKEVRSVWGDLLRRDGSAARAAVPPSAAVKVEIVSNDIQERGSRAYLNFGHTYAHAIEHVAGYGRFSHGEAVAIGMTCALLLSADYFADFDPKPALDLTTSIPLYSDPSTLSPDAIFDAMIRDKKSRDGQRRFVLLHDIGQPELIACNDRDRVLKSWHSACSTLKTVSSPSTVAL